MPEQVRRPAVAGQFYPSTATELTGQIEECFQHRLGPGTLPTLRESGPREIVGLVSPHAGYVFSGPTAAHGYHALAADGIPQVVIVIGLNHGRGGTASAVQTSGAWQTPLGLVPIHDAVAADIAAKLPGFANDADAFRLEHSLEVQLPFLQYIYDEHLVFVPVMMAGQDLASARMVGEAVAEGVGGCDALIVASTDMTHYETADTARRQDQMLIERIEALDPEGLIHTRDRRGISMCGAGPVAAMIIAARALGATRAETLAYSTSGDIVPAREVVGYYCGVVRR